jgi:hypothetical protein
MLGCGIGGIGGFMLAVISGSGGLPSPVALPAGSAPAVSRGPIPRAEFQKLVSMKTPEEVLSAVGRPDATELQGSKNMDIKVSAYDALWTYRRATVDPVSSNVDEEVQVRFFSRAAVEVTFHP